MDISLSKEIDVRKHTIMFGVNIYNIFDKPYPFSVYPLTGTPNRPGEYYEKYIGKELSGSFYDRPWYYSNNREINFFVRIDLN